MHKSPSLHAVLVGLPPLPCAAWWPTADSPFGALPSVPTQNLQASGKFVDEIATVHARVTDPKTGGAAAAARAVVCR